MGSIGNQIKKAREEKGWTQEELSAKMGYKSKSTINKIELGINDVTQSKIVKFSEVLDVSISYLMNWDENIINELSAIQQEANEYDAKFDWFVEKLRELTPSEQEFKEILAYAEYLKSKRAT